MEKMTEYPSWDRYAPSIISELNLKETSKDEWHGPCPNCGGKDRFWITNIRATLRHTVGNEDFAAINDALSDMGCCHNGSQTIPP